MPDIQKSLKRWKITAIIFIVIAFLAILCATLFFGGAITQSQDLHCDISCLKEGYAGNDMDLVDWTTNLCGCYGDYLYDTPGGEYIINNYLSEE